MYRPSSTRRLSAAAFLLIWLLSRGAGWVVRDVFRQRFGFPAQYPPDPGLDRRHFKWTSLLMSRVGSLVTNNVYGAATDEGLAFEIGIHGGPFMHPVLIPWQALRKATDGNDILVVDETGKRLTCLSPGRPAMPGTRSSNRTSNDPKPMAQAECCQQTLTTIRFESWSGHDVRPAWAKKKKRGKVPSKLPAFLAALPDVIVGDA